MIYRVEFYDPYEGSLGFLYTGSKKEALRERSRWVESRYSSEMEEYVEQKQIDPDNSCPHPNRETWKTLIEEIPTPKNKREVLAILNRYGAHPDNG